MPNEFADFATDYESKDSFMETWIQGDDATIRIQVRICPENEGFFGLIVSTGDKQPVVQSYGFNLEALIKFCDAVKAIRARDSI